MSTEQTTDAVEADLHHDENMKFSTLMYVCDDTRQWIIQADTKGGFLLTINGVVSGFMIPQIVKFMQFWTKQSGPSWALWLLLALNVMYIVWQLKSFWSTAQVFVPRTPGDQSKQSEASRHVFNYSLVRHFGRLTDWPKLKSEYLALSEAELESEYLNRLHVDSMVCNAKYQAFFLGFKSMLWSLGFAFLAFLGNLIMAVK